MTPEVYKNLKKGDRVIANNEFYRLSYFRYNPISDKSIKIYGTVISRDGNSDDIHISWDVDSINDYYNSRHPHWIHTHWIHLIELAIDCGIKCRKNKDIDPVS